MPVFTTFTQVASATVDAVTTSLFMSEVTIQGKQRINVTIVTGSIIAATGIISQAGSCTATITAQRTFDGGSNWLDVDDWIVASGNFEYISDKPEPETCQYRLVVKAGDHTSGDCVCRLGSS